MPKVVKVPVVWGKEKFKLDLPDYENMNGKDLKNMLFEKTGIPIERQTILGLTPTPLKDTDNLKSIKISKKKIKLIGSTEKMAEPPKEKVVFLEDQPGYNEEYSEELYDIPKGIPNLGNTCYANSAIQCLSAIPELKTVLTKKNGNIKPAQPESAVVSSLQELLQQLNQTKNNINPTIFINVVRKIFPQFAEQQDGVYLQQDADEFLYTIITALRNQIDEKLMNKLFEIEFETTMKCLETEEEPMTKINEKSYKLECDTQQGSNNLFLGIEKNFNGQVEKNSQILSRNAIFEKKQKIKKLPQYLVVHFNRFFWKKKEQIRAKVLRDVKFPINLDVFEFCTEETKEEMKPIREKLQKEKEERLKKEKEEKLEGKTNEKIENPTNILEKDLNISEIPEKNNHGWYELVGVITHKGRYASSGHYIGWCKDKHGRWVKFDDDVVTLQTEEQILKLSGGGDHHTAYILLFATKNEAP